ncbi:hypothetical protein SLA2020_098980 [Shorea laevis]
MAPNKVFLSALSLLLVVLQPSLVESKPLEPPRKHLSDLFQNLEESHKGQNLKGLHLVKQYLQSLGYYPNGVDVTTNDDFDEHLESAIKTYQQYYHLNVTGNLDSYTIEALSERRCGVPDFFVLDQNLTTNSSKMKFGIKYSFFPNNPKWPTTKLDLTYSFKSGDGIHVDLALIRPIVERAYKRWQDISPLTFKEGNSNSNIKIGFFRRNHGDGTPFDGPGKTFAHAFPPQDGRVHFDADEPNWKFGDPGPNEIDFESIALHEFGHSIGLGHSTIKGAVMNPYYTIGEMRRQITPDDKLGVDVLYGG